MQMFTAKKKKQINLVIFFSDPDILVEKKVKDVKKSKDDSKENFDLSDIEKNSQDGFFGGTVGTVASVGPLLETTVFEPDMCNIAVASNLLVAKESAPNVQPVSLDKLEINSPDATTPTENNNEISTCVVCAKKFKSKSCMNKHLRSVHAGMLMVSCIFVSFVKFL